MHPNNVDGCVKPEFEVKIANFSFYTRVQGRINAYFKFKPLDYAQWNETMPSDQEKAEDELISGALINQSSLTDFY